MSLTATPVTAAGNGYYFALANDPGLGQTLSLTGDTLAISGGNSVDVANATTVSTSKVKLTAQTYIAGFNTTNFTGDVRSEGRVISAPPLGNGTATLNGSLANVTITGIGGNNPSVLFEKSVDKASIVYNGSDILMSTIKVSTITVNAEIYDSFGNPGSAGQVLQSSGAGLPFVWGAGGASGVTSVVGGSNILVDSTNPLAPVVNLSINNTVDMNSNVITNLQNAYFTGTAQGLVFQDPLNVANGTLLSDVDGNITMKADNGSVTVDGNQGVLVKSTSNAVTLEGSNIVINGLDGGLQASLSGTFSVTGTAMEVDVTGDITMNTLGFFTVQADGNNFFLNGSAGGLAVVNVDGDVTLKGTNPSVNFVNTSNIQKAFLDYVESSDKITLSGNDVVAESVGAGRGHRMILDAAGAALTSQDADVTIQRSQTGVGIKTLFALKDNGNITMGALGLTTDPSIRLESSSNSGEFVSIAYDSFNDKGIIQTGTNGQLRFEGGSSFVMQSGGTTDILSSDPITINANDSSIVMSNAIVMNSYNGDITMTANSDDDTANIQLQAGNRVKLISKDGVLDMVSDVSLTTGGGSITVSSTAGNGTFIASGQVDITAQTADATVSAGNNINLNAVGVNITASSGAGTIKLGGITAYDPAYGSVIQADVDNLDQVLTNNAYVPMTWYKRDIGFTIDPTQSIAFRTGGFPWKYSGFWGGLNGDSRYCGALKFQIDVNISAVDLDSPIVWWVILFNNNNGAAYYSTDFTDENFGFITQRITNPFNGTKNTTVCFSSTFDLDSAFTGQPIPVDGESLEIRVYGWSQNSVTTPRAQVSATIRPLRNLQ